MLVKANPLELPLMMILIIQYNVHFQPNSISLSSLTEMLFSLADYFQFL